MSSDYNADDDFAKSLDVGYAAVRERMAAGGPGWTPRVIRTPASAAAVAELQRAIAAVDRAIEMLRRAETERER